MKTEKVRCDANLAKLSLLLYEETKLLLKKIEQLEGEVSSLKWHISKSKEVKT